MLPVALDFGGFNDCPSATEHAAVWRHWGTAYGAQPVGIANSDLLYGIVRQPPQATEAHARFVAEMCGYDQDTLAAGAVALYCETYRNVAMAFWWD